MNQFDEKFLQWGKISEITTLWVYGFTKKEKRFEQFRIWGIYSENYGSLFALSHWKNISSNHLFSNFFGIIVISRNFSQKCVRVNSRNFHTVQKPHITWKQRNNESSVSLLIVTISKWYLIISFFFLSFFFEKTNSIHFAFPYNRYIIENLFSKFNSIIDRY